jgi:cytochrome oxidase Cu insertion factor (SCO1/SenC/PrrC family)
MPKRNIKFGLLLLTLLLSTILAACGSSPTAPTNNSSGVSGNPVSTTAPTSIKAVKGSIAPDLTGTDINGQAVKLSSFKGKAVLVNFWTTW